MVWTLVNCSGATGTDPTEGSPIDYCRLQSRDASRFASRSCRSSVPVIKTEDRARGFCIQVCPPRNARAHFNRSQTLVVCEVWKSRVPTQRQLNSPAATEEIFLMHSPLYVSMSFWNSLPTHATSAASSNSFRCLMNSLLVWLLLTSFLCDVHLL